MSKYRKKPVVIEAFQWRGCLDSPEQPEWFIDALHRGEVNFNERCVPNAALFISTLEGEMRADIGDFIIMGIKGEIYPCKADIFEATYEAVDE